MTTNLNEAAVIVSGASGDNHSHVNGVYLFQSMKDDKPIYHNVSNNHNLYCASDGFWTVSGVTEGDARNGPEPCCVCLEVGLNHPSQSNVWLFPSDDDLEEQPAVKVATMVYKMKLS